MECNWIKISPNLQKGLSLINTLDDTKFEQFLKRIVLKLINQETDHVFTEEERKKLEIIFKIDEEKLLLAIKTIIYVFKRVLKFIFMPVDLRQDFITLGLNEEKADVFSKVWCAETSTTLNELTNSAGDQYENNPEFSWKLNAELSSVYHKKCKVPKAYIKIIGNKNEAEVELTHNELHAIFLQFESIENELDNLLLP
ncbi:uncharacterized protein LOC123698399 [Colias croceus]|uniref:uncharacterized protein LOC123698399 n=1 Tax=Colias crocea TaxID=72248 RepID=UPI001E27ED3A|nr:uncharacterized protein LOC123698399 [Colias croceus]